MAVKLTVPITLEGQDSTKRAFESAKKSASSLADTITAVSTGWIAFGRTAAASLRAPFERAAEVERANKQLVLSMQSMDRYTTAAYGSVKDFTKEMSKMSGVNQDALDTVMATNIAFGMNEESAKAATQAALGFSAVSGKDVVDANKAMIATLSGSVDEVQKYVPEVRSLTRAQDAAGEAINRTADRLRRFIGADLDTASGGFQKLSNQLKTTFTDSAGKFLEGLGESGAFKVLTEALDDLAKVVRDNDVPLKEFARTLGTEGAAALREFTEALRILGPQLPNLAKDMVDFTKVALIPFIDLTASALSIWAHFTGRKDLEARLDAMMEHNARAFKKSLDSLLAYKDELAKPMPQPDFQISKADEQAEEGGGFWERLAAGWKNNFKRFSQGMQQDQREASAQMAKTLQIASGAAPSSGGYVDFAPSLPAAARPDNKPSPKANVKLPLSKEELEMQIQMRRQLKDQTLAVQLEETNELLASHTLQLVKIDQMEQDAQRKRINVTREAAALRAALEAQFVEQVAKMQIADRVGAAQAAGDTAKAIEATQAQELQSYAEMVQKKHMTDEEYVNAVRESARKVKLFWMGNEVAIANATGETTRSIEGQLAIQLEQYEDMLKKKLMSDEEYELAKAEAERNADAAARQTTGSKAMDEAIQQGTAVINSVQGGLNSIVGTIGGMFGPIGNLIAGIFQFFNQTPAEFKKMIDGLIDNIIDLPNRMMSNIPYLIAKIISSIPAIIESVIMQMVDLAGPLIMDMASAVLETLPDVLGKLLSVGFWVGIANKAFKAFQDSFKNLMSVIFSGKAIKSALDMGGDVKKSLATFGSDDPNAGDGQFKIKDADLRNRRKAQSFEDSFADTVDQGGKSLSDILKEAFQGIYDWFKSLPQKIVDGLLQLRDAIGQMGKAIWDGLWGAISAAAALIGSMGTWIYNGLKGGLDTLWTWFSAAGMQTFYGLKAGLDTIWQWFADAGGQVYRGLKGGLDSLWNWFRDAGKEIFYGFADVFKLPGGGGSSGVNIGGVHIGHDGGYATASMANGGLARVFHQAGALHFANGGVVPGSGFNDKVPALLRPNERVLTPEEQKSGAMGSKNEYHFTFNVHPNAKFDKEAVKEAMPLIIDQVRRESRNGTPVVRAAGVY